MSSNNETAEPAAEAGSNNFLNQSFNVSNYMYYSQYTPINDTTLQNNVHITPLLKNGKPLESTNAAEGLSEEAFITTGSGPEKIIIGYEGTDLYDANNPSSNEFTGGQVVADAQIVAGQTPQSFISAAKFAQSVVNRAPKYGVSRSDVLVTGHSLGGAEAEYAAAKLGLAGYTFGAPGIIAPSPSKTLSHRLKASPPNVQNYVDYGDPVGNYASDAPTSYAPNDGYAPLLLSQNIKHYGSVVPEGASGSDGNAYYLSPGIEHIQDYLKTGSSYEAATGLYDFGVSIDYHSLCNYQTDLKSQGVVLDPIGNETCSSTAVDANFITPLLSSAPSTAAAQVACYREGTTIRTSEGMRRVEHLQAGDLVVTAAGDLRPVKWLGHRTIDCRHRCRHEVLPVRIAAHAFGDNIPTHDLDVSPGHAVCIDVSGEVLIPAAALVNGSTIAQIEVDSVTYWHVELDRHDIILAQGVPAESYQDRGNRDFFAEHDLVALVASPDVGMPADACRPVYSDGPFVEAARARLRARATSIEVCRRTRGSNPALEDAATQPQRLMGGR